MLQDLWKDEVKTTLATQAITVMYVKIPHTCKLCTKSGFASHASLRNIPFSEME